MPMSNPRELEWAKEPDALKESWKARIRTHIVHGVPLTVGPSMLLSSCAEVSPDYTSPAM